MSSSSVKPRRFRQTPARSYIEFYPNGRTEEATIELRGRQGEVYQVLCESASERFHIVSPIGDTK